LQNVKNPNSNLGSSDGDHDSNEEFQNETNNPGFKNDATTIVSPVVAVDSEILDHMEIYSIHSFTSEDNMPLCDDDQSSNDVLFDPDEFLVEPIQSTSAQQQQAQSHLDREANDKGTSCKITLHRTVLQDELLQYFKNPDIIYVCICQ